MQQRLQHHKADFNIKFIMIEEPINQFTQLVYINKHRWMWYHSFVNSVNYHTLLWSEIFKR